MESYIKSAMPVNAENYLKAHAGLELKTSKLPPITAVLSVTSTNCGTETTPIKIVPVAPIRVVDNAVYVVY